MAEIEKITSSKEDCALKCQSSSSCNHFTWHNDTCLLQSSPIIISSGKYKKGSICGILKGTKTENGMRKNLTDKFYFYYKFYISIDYRFD